MKQIFSVVAISLLLTFSVFAKAGKEVKVYVNLSPTGSFEAISTKVKGSVRKKGDLYMAKKIMLSANSLNTGMDLRDKHLRKRFKKKKILVRNAKGKGGRGVAKIKINGIEKKVSFKYSELGSKFVKAVFNLKLKDFKFEDIRYLGVGVEDVIKIEATIPVK